MIKNILNIFWSKFWIKKNWFWYIQIIIFFIAIIVVQTNSLLTADMFFRKMIMKVRNITIQTNENKITLVALDENFFEKEETSYSWLHRWYYAKVLENLLKQDPKIIVVDVFFEKWQKFSGNWSKIKVINEIFGSFDKSLTDAINDKVILAWIYDFGSWANWYKSWKVKNPSEIFMKNNPIVWHVHSVQLNNINIWIYNYLQDSQTKEIMYPIWMEAYLHYTLNNLKAKVANWSEIVHWIKQDEKNDFLMIQIANIKKIIPWIQYWNTPPFIFTPLYYYNINQLKEKWAYISFYDAYTWNFPQDKVKDKVVFIWATDIALNDIKNTLLWAIPWVLTHINLFLSINNNDYIYILKKEPVSNILSISKDPNFIFIMWILLLNVVIFRVFKRKKENTEIYLIQLLIIGLLITFWQIALALPWISKVTQVQYSIFLPIWTLTILLFMQIVFNLIYSYLDTYNLKDSFQRLFKIYVWSKVDDNASERIEEIEKWYKKAEEKNMVIFFSDIAWFTEMSEKLTPEQNIITLNEYLEDMTKEIINKWWTIDKFIWDAIMAYWWDEKSSDLWAKSAIGNIMNLKSINKRIKSQLNIWLEEKDLIDIRIWLHYWKVIHWDIWYSWRLNETIIWDNVNLASRLEWINKFYKTRICMSADFWNSIIEKDKFLSRKLDLITVKWKNKPVEIYELIPIYPELLSSQHLQEIKKFINIFEEWLEQYFQWNFEKAIQLFETTLTYNKDETSKIFINRCKEIIKMKVEKWDWIRKFESK